MMPSDSSGRSPTTTAPGAWIALLLLVLINLFNYIDRQVLAAVEPQIRKQFFPPSTDGKEPEEAKMLMGWLSTAFLVTYMLLAPVFGAMATYTPRWLLIAVGVIVWSLATGASGASDLVGRQMGGAALALFGYMIPMAFLVMLLTRCLVGVGEAVYGPVAPDIIADLYPVEKRGSVMAWFYAAIPIGGAIGYGIGGVINSMHDVHWRFAFYVVVPPGILLGLWCLFMNEPKREGHGAADEKIARRPAWGDYAELFGIPSYTLNAVGMTFMCFAMGGLAHHASGFLDYRGRPVDEKGLGEAVKVLNLPPELFFGVLLAGLGLAATVLGGLVGDWLRPRASGAYFLVSGVAMLVGAPLLLATVYLPFPLAWLPLAGFVFCLFFNTGPTNTINANVVRPDLRARGFAVNILVIHLFGDAVAPPILGAIAGKENRYDNAFLLVSALVLLGGLAWMWGAAFLQRDTEAASGAPATLPPLGSLDACAGIAPEPANPEGIQGPGGEFKDRP